MVKDYVMGVLISISHCNFKMYLIDQYNYGLLYFYLNFRIPIYLMV